MSAEGILIVGLNGCGKTTLGRALADALGYYRMDVEDYYFLPSDNPYAVSRTKDEVRQLLIEDIVRHPRFVLSSVNGEWGEAIFSRVRAVVFLHAPLDVRLSRIDRRSGDRFGTRVAPGGDMFEQERRFRDIAAARTEHPVEEWLASTQFSVLHVDATLPTDKIVSRVIRWLSE